MSPARNPADDGSVDGRGLDDTDRALLDLLEADGRLPVSGLATRLGIARSTVQQRLGRLERSGAIAGYTIRRGAAVDAGVTAQVAIVVDGRRADAVVGAIAAIDEVRALHAVIGPVDLLAEVHCRHAMDLDAIIDRVGRIAGVVRTETTILLADKLTR